MKMRIFWRRGIINEGRSNSVYRILVVLFLFLVLSGGDDVVVVAVAVRTVVVVAITVFFSPSLVSSVAASFSPVYLSQAPFPLSLKHYRIIPHIHSLPLPLRLPLHLRTHSRIHAHTA